VTRQSFDRFFRILVSSGAILAFSAIELQAQQPPAGAKVIQDHAEYSAYMAATNTQDPTARAQALEGFCQKYSRSVVFIDALEEEMEAWQAAGNSAEVKKTAKRLLAVDSGNIRALGIVVALDRVSAEQGDTAALNEMCVDATGGMLAVPMWRKPAGMSDANYDTLSKLMNVIFLGAEGYCAIQQKNYSQAREWLGRAIKTDPANAADTYQLAIADLESVPVVPEGLWYCARAIHLAQASAIPQDARNMAADCEARYAKYHGAGDGWDALLAAAAAQDAPPSGFAQQVKAAAGAGQK
jgi:tetratricopeptide (TPR) repeat protein